MKVITIKQPWASLIAGCYKEYEFRTWKTKYRGPILIHAGKGIDKKALKKFEHLNLTYPLGCIIAKANLTDCVYITDEFGEYLYQKDRNVYAHWANKGDWDGYGFKLENIEEISPIEVNGQLGLWEFDINKI